MYEVTITAPFRECYPAYCLSCASSMEKASFVMLLKLSRVDVKEMQRKALKNK